MTQDIIAEIHFAVMMRSVMRGGIVRDGVIGGGSRMIGSGRGVVRSRGRVIRVSRVVGSGVGGRVRRVRGGDVSVRLLEMNVVDRSGVRVDLKSGFLSLGLSLALVMLGLVEQVLQLLDGVQIFV